MLKFSLRPFLIFMYTLLVIAGVAFADTEPTGSASQEEMKSAQSADTYETQKKQLLDEQEELLQKLKKRLRQSVNELGKIQDSISEFQFDIAETEARVIQLDAQIANVDRQIARAEEQMINVTRQIEEKELEIGALMDELSIKELQIEDQVDVLKEYLRFLYFQESTFYDPRTSEFNLIKLLLDDERFSENERRLNSLNRFEIQGASILERLNLLKENLEIEQQNVEVKRLSLKMLRKTVNDHKINLEALKAGKKRLLIETQGKQYVFERLVEKETAQDEQIAQEISTITLNIHALDSALAKMKVAGTPEELEEAVKIRDEILELKKRASLGDLGEGSAQMRWPLSPYRGLTAYFDDAGYRSRFGVNHYAVDIRAPHGSPVFAAADGIVMKTIGKDSDDIGYHYVLIAHRGGFQTLYGHVSKILIEEGQFVRQGDMIALSGGTPGSTGSGYRTTGPHLHFEVYLFGAKVDPLEYLPLSPLPLKYVPQDKIKKLYEEQLKVTAEHEENSKLPEETRLIVPMEELND